MIKEELIQPILRTIGYYPIKAKIKRHFYLKKLRREDSARNAKLREQILAVDHRILPDVVDGQNLTVSLTTHGKRVADFVPYAIWSILQQTKLPNRIVLNIDEIKWNNDNLPELIKKLQIAGLEVNFCEDVGPHTKFLPALAKYPDDVIITVDDDILYESEAVERLWNAYEQSDKKTVLCRSGKLVKRENGKMLPYSQWSSTLKMKSGDVISPYGVSGVLYPPHIFSNEIFNKEVYQKNCKYADDIWFTMMEIRENIRVQCISNVPWNEIDVSRVEEWEVVGSEALHFQNDGALRNDHQLELLIRYYEL